MQTSKRTLQPGYRNSLTAMNGVARTRNSLPRPLVQPSRGSLVRADVSKNGVEVSQTLPSVIGPRAWSELAGSHEVDFCYGHMRALEEHPFNDSTRGRTFWWEVREGTQRLGVYSGYVSETFRVASLFSVGWRRKAADMVEGAYQALNRRGFYHLLEKTGLAKWLRLSSGRTRAMYLTTHAADVGGHGIGAGLRQGDAARWLPALHAMINRESGLFGFGVEQVVFREVAERDEGPFHFPNLWEARGQDGRRIFEANGFRRDPGLPAAYLDLRTLQKAQPIDRAAVLGFYRHPTVEAYLEYETARGVWLAGIREFQALNPGASVPFELVVKHPIPTTRGTSSRLSGLRLQFFRSGIFEENLVPLAQLDRAEGWIISARARIVRMEQDRQAVRDLDREIDGIRAKLPAGHSFETFVRALQVQKSLVRLQEWVTLEREADALTAAGRVPAIVKNIPENLVEGGVDLRASVFRFSGESDKAGFDHAFAEWTSTGGAKAKGHIAKLLNDFLPGGTAEDLRDLIYRTARTSAISSRVDAIRSLLGLKKKGLSPTDLLSAASRRGAELQKLSDLSAEEAQLSASMTPDFVALKSNLRVRMADYGTNLNSGMAPTDPAMVKIYRIATFDLGVHMFGWSDTRRPTPDELTQVDAEFKRFCTIAVAEKADDARLRTVRTEITELERHLGVRSEDVGQWLEAEALLASYSGSLPSEWVKELEAIEAVHGRQVALQKVIADTEASLAKEASDNLGLLLGERGEQVRAELQREMNTVFAREQDLFAGIEPTDTPETRERKLRDALTYRPVPYAEILAGIGSLRDSDRKRYLREHQASDRNLAASSPNVVGLSPTAPVFNSEGYLARGLAFVGRDERVWTNQADRDQVSRLYHMVMDKSAIAHEVFDWPYYEAYRKHGAQSGDEIYWSTLRAGGPEGPIVAAVSLKRSPGGHVRPERIALNGESWGAYHTLVLQVMLKEYGLGADFVSLCMTSQGTKVRDFGCSLTDAHYYTRFQGLSVKALGFPKGQEIAFDQINLAEIPKLAEMPPGAEKEEAMRRAGIHWRV